MKLITNSAEIKVTENEDGSKSFQGIGSEVGVENLNGIILTPNCIEFARERYPLLYEHGAGYDPHGNRKRRGHCRAATPQ